MDRSHWILIKGIQGNTIEGIRISIGKEGINGINIQTIGRIGGIQIDAH